MILIAISENICRIDKIIGKATFNKYPDVNWGEVKGIRNILAHAYFDADHEEVYTICACELECLKQTLAKIRSNI